jgi:hypothetical protein
VGAFAIDPAQQEPGRCHVFCVLRQNDFFEMLNNEN